MPLVNSVGVTEPGNALNPAIFFGRIKSLIEPGHDSKSGGAVNSRPAHSSIPDSASRFSSMYFEVFNATQARAAKNRAERMEATITCHDSDISPLFIERNTTNRITDAAKNSHDITSRMKL